MSDNGEYRSESDKLLPFPRRIAITTVTDGSYSKNVPTIYLSYIGSDDLPFEIVDMLDGIAVDIQDENTLAVCIFIPTDVEDDFKFAEMYSINLVAPPETIKAFSDDIKKIDKFGFIFSTDEYEAKFLVQHSSAQIIDESYVERILN